MHTPLNHRSSIVVITVFVFLLAALSLVIFNNYQISITPKPPQSQGCSREAKVCPDGSTVGRMPPSCEFAPCNAVDSTPYVTGGNSGPQTASIMPINPGESPLSKLPDLPLQTFPLENNPQTVRYIVEHRTALNNRKVSIAGTVVAANLKQPECKPGGACPDMYLMPNIVIADSNASNRDKAYDLRVNMIDTNGSNADQYPVGQQVSIYGVVVGDKENVVVNQ